MPFKAVRIEITDKIRNILYKFARSRTLSVRQVQRAKIFLLCADELNNMQISIRVGLGQDSVSRWRTRFSKALPRLVEIEKKSPKDLEKEVSVVLMDEPRPGQPATYTDEQIIKILEIACRDPKEYGYEVSHWSLNQLVNAVIKEGIVESISAKTISRFLKYGENPPSSRPLLAAFLGKSGQSGHFCGESE